MKSAAEPQIIGALIGSFVFPEVSAIFWGGPSKISVVIGCAQKRRFGVILKTHEDTQTRMKSAAEPKWLAP